MSRAYGLDRRLHGVNYQGAASAETLQKVSKAVAGSSSPDIAAVILACLSSHDEMEDGCIQMGVLARLMEAGLIEVDTEIPALSLTDDQLILHVLQRLGSPRQLIGPLLCDDEVPAQVLLNAAVELANKVETFLTSLFTGSVVPTEVKRRQGLSVTRFRGPGGRGCAGAHCSPSDRV